MADKPGFELKQGVNRFEAARADADATFVVTSEAAGPITPDPLLEPVLADHPDVKRAEAKAKK